MFHGVFCSYPLVRVSSWALFAGLMMGLSSCGTFTKADAEAQTQRQRPEGGSAAVDVQVAKTALLEQNQKYTGTTQPYRQVSLRSQTEGQIVNLSVDVGDRVTQGQTLGQLEDNVLTAAVVQAEAEVAARQSEVAEARIEVTNARTQVEETRLRLQQAETDLKRFEQLFREGAIPSQQVENARLTVGTTRQTLRSVQEQVRNRQQSVATAQRRVTAQQAIVAQQRERQSYSVVTSPVTGFVLERTLEPGNLAQPGSEILKLGDFSQVKIVVQVSERELGTIKVGQPVQVQLDAFPTEQLTGRVSRVSPAADPTARLIPVEVTIPNSNGKLGSGLLARVNFSEQSIQRVVVPETALQTNQNRRAARDQAKQSNSSGETQGRAPTAPKAGTLFVIAGSGKQTIAESRQVSLGDRQDGLVEIVSGLKAGERYISRSNKALKDGAPVQLSVISEN